MNNKIFFNEQEHLNDESTALFVDALHLNRTKDLPEEIQTHVDSCEICKKNILDLLMLTDAAYSINEKNHPYFGKLKRKDTENSANKYLLLKIAAMIIVIAALFFLINKNVQKPSDIEIVQNKESLNKLDMNKEITPLAEKEEEPKETVDSEKNSKTVRNRDLYAANYQKSSVLEEMINTHFRSSSLKIQSPLNEKKFQANEKIFFNWTFPKKQIPLTLIIFNNREDTIKITEGLRNTFELKEKLMPGLYYWKLETEDELLHLGKFLIE